MEKKKLCEFNLNKLASVHKKKKVKSIIDLNIDCLEHIFKFLKLEDMLNVAHTCRKFKIPAAFAFNTIYGDKIIRIRDLRIINLWGIREAEGIEFGPEILGLKECLQIVRCFGQFISKLIIISERYGKPESRIRFILVLCYVQKYCSNNLTDITIGQCPIGSLEQLTKTFPQVKNVQICDRYVGRNRLNKLFPKMESLKYDKFDGALCLKSIENHFPNMKCLEIGQYKREKFKSNNLLLTPRLESILNALRLNQQLHTLNITYTLKADFIQLISECLPHLKSLKIVCSTADFSKCCANYEAIRFKHVNNLDIKLLHYLYNADHCFFRAVPLEKFLPTLRISSSELEELNLDVEFKILSRSEIWLFREQEYRQTNTCPLKLTSYSLGMPLWSLIEIDFEYWYKRLKPNFHKDLENEWNTSRRNHTFFT